MSQIQFVKTYLAALYDGDADALRRLAADYPRFWADQRLVGDVSQILDDQTLSDDDRRAALRRFSYQLCAYNVMQVCVAFATMHSMLFLAYLFNAALFPIEAFANASIAALYFILGASAKSSPKLYIRLAFAFSIVVWLYIALSYAEREWAIIMFIPCVAFAIASYIIGPSSRFR